MQKILTVSLTSLVLLTSSPIYSTTPSSNAILDGTYTLSGSGTIIDASLLENQTGYFLHSGEMTITGVTLQNFTTTGGSGSGGGGGFGGALFINSGATVNLNNVIFNANKAIGGSGGSGSYGGVLNNLFTPTINGSNGSDGDNATAGGAIENAGNGRNGYTGTPGGAGSSGFGGSGGNGGSGGPGTGTTADIVKTTGEITFDLTKSSVEYSKAAEDTAEATEETDKATEETDKASEETEKATDETALASEETEEGTEETAEAGEETAKASEETAEAGEETAVTVELAAGAAGEVGAEAEFTDAAAATAAAVDFGAEAGTVGGEAATTGSEAATDGSEAATFGSQAATAGEETATSTDEATTDTAEAATDTAEATTDTAEAATETTKSNLDSQLAVADAALATAEGVYLVAIQTTSYLIDGVAGIGGNGGNGGAGGTGSDFFGGGPGGGGGTGGDAVAISISSGGFGGSGGSGGAGGFGAGGGLSGSAGSGGDNGTYATVNNGSLNGTPGTPGTGGFGGGIGSIGNGTDSGTNGNGGSGYGGAIFVRTGGILNINGPCTFNKNAVLAGQGTSGGTTGQTTGTDLFMMTGSAVTINPGEGYTVTFNGTIADDSSASIGSTIIPAGQGASLSIQSGVVAFNGANTYTGQTLLQGGVLQALDGTGVHAYSNINIAGGIFETSGTFNRFLGTGCDRIQWTGSGGLSALNGALLISLNNGETLTWASGSFVPDGSNLVFGSATATDTVTLANPINLNGGIRTILVTPNTGNTNQAILNGVISNGSLTLGDGSHGGVVVLAAANTYTGTTTIGGGTTILQGSITGTTVQIDSGANLQDQSGGLAPLTSLTADGTLSVEADQTILSLFGSGVVSLDGGSLTLSNGSFSGQITDTNDCSSLIKVSSGTLTLSGTCTYVGPTQIQAGTLVLTGSLETSSILIPEGATLTDSNGGLASTTAVTNEGTFVLGANDTIASLVNTGSVNGSYTLTAATYDLNSGSVINANLGTGSITTTGSVALNGTSDASSITISSGTLTLGSAGRLSSNPTVTVTGALVLGGSESVGSLLGDGAVSIANGPITVLEGDFSGIISGDYGLTKSSSGTLTLSGTCTYTGTTIVSGGTLILAGSIAGTTTQINSGATLEDQSSGLPVLTSLTANGTFSIQADQTILSLFGSGIVNLDGGSITVSNGAFSGQIIDTPENSSLIKVSSGTLTLSGTSTYIGPTEIQAGTLVLTGSLQTASLLIADGAALTDSSGGLASTTAVTNEGTFTLGASDTIASLMNTGSVNGSYTLTAATYDLNGGSVINANLGTGAITTTGSVSLNGTSGASTVAVSSGTLTLGSTGRFSSNPTVTVTGALILGGSESVGSLLGDGTVSIANGPITVLAGDFSGVISGGYGLTKSSSETLSLSGTNTYTGATLINDGTLILAGSITGTTVQIARGATLQDQNGGLASTTSLTANGTLSVQANQTILSLLGSGIVSLDGGSLTIGNGTFSGQIVDTDASSLLIKVSSGILTLSGTNTYAGQTQIQAGTLVLTGSLETSSLLIANGATLSDSSGGLASMAAVTNRGTFTLGANDTIASLINTGIINGSGYTLTAATYDLNDGSIVNVNLGTGAITATGSVSLNGTSEASSVTVSSGTLTLGSAERFSTTPTVTLDGTLVLGGDEMIDSLSGSGTLSMQNGGLTLNQGDFSGAIEGSYGLTKISSNILSLSGTSTYTGQTNIDDGTVILTGSLESSSLAIASGASLYDQNGGLSTEATLTNEGTLDLGADNTISVLNNSGVIRGTGYTLSASEYNLSDGSIIQANLGTGVLSTTGTVYLYGTTSLDTVNVAVGSTVNLMGAEILPDTSTVNVDGSLVLNGGNQTVNVLNGSGLVYANTYEFIVNGGGDFTGQIITENTNVSVQGGSLNLTNTIVSANNLQVNNGSTLNISGSSSNANANNITVTSNSTMNISDQSAVVNSGDVTVQSQGVLSVASGASLSTAGNINMNENSSISIEPSSSVSASTITTQDNSVLTVPNSSSLSYSVLTGTGTIDTQGSVFVNQSTVSGFVTFSGNFTNQGVLAPGNSPGLIVIGGNYTEAASLIIQIENTTPISGYDQVRVGGTVTLLPSSVLTVEVYNGGFPKVGYVYQIIANSVGGPIPINGAFGSIEFQGTGAPQKNAAVLFDLATGQLLASGLDQNSSQFSDLGTNNNEKRAASALYKVAQVAPNQINTLTDIGQLAKQIIDGKHSPSYNLARYTPTYYSGLADFAMLGDRSLARQIQDRVSPLVDLPNQLCSNVALFSGYLESNNKNADGARLKRRDLYLGGDFCILPGFSIGIALSGIMGHVHADLGKTNVAGGSAFLYSLKTLGSSFKGFGAFGYSIQNNSSHRPTANGHVRGSNATSGLTGMAGLLYEGWAWGPFSLAPRLNLLYSYAHVHSFSEKGAKDALHIGEYHANFFSGELGFSGLYSTLFLNRAFNLEFTGGVQQAFVEDKNNLQVDIIAVSDVSYGLEFKRAVRTVGNYGVNIEYNIWKKAGLYAGYEGFTGSGWNYTINAGVRIGI